MPRHSRLRAAFTLTELLVVILIIAILIAILIPTISSVRQSAWQADTKNLISQINGAITRYHQDFSAYPGVFADHEILGISGPVPAVPAGGGVIGSGDPITMTENMVLSLLGGIRIEGSNRVFDPSLTTSAAGATSLGAPKRHAAYMNVREGLLSDGKMADSGITGMNDSSIPEFLDTWPTGDQLPILYMRARRGANGIVSNSGNDPMQYDLRYIDPYLRDGTDGLQDIGGIDDPVDGTPRGNARAYFKHPSLGTSGPNGTPVAKDTFVLIAPGPDRIYGTNDDITSWGN